MKIKIKKDIRRKYKDYTELTPVYHENGPMKGKIWYTKPEEKELFIPKDSVVEVSNFDDLANETSHITLNGNDISPAEYESIMQEILNIPENILEIMEEHSSVPEFYKLFKSLKSYFVDVVETLERLEDKYKDRNGNEVYNEAEKSEILNYFRDVLYNTRDIIATTTMRGNILQCVKELIDYFDDLEIDETIQDVRSKKSPEEIGAKLTELEEKRKSEREKILNIRKIKPKTKDDIANIFNTK